MVPSGAVPGASRLLVVDDDPAIPALIERFARKLGFDVTYRDNGRDALVALPDVRPDVALVDLQMPELNGIDVLKAVRAADPDCQVILMTGNATVETAIEAVKAGALDYLAKPIDFDRLRQLLVDVRDSIHRRELMMEGDAEVARQFEFHGMIGRSLAMQELFDSIRRLAPHARTVLVTGETGTGKELVARALHQAGARRERRFVTLNCSAVVETLFESELFGHVRGAFTGATEPKAGAFEHADGGTLFLDEAGDLPLPMQAKLLRTVEFGEIQGVGSFDTKTVDVHVIAATSRNLRAEAAAGRFREDLFYRLSVIELRLVPLRQRVEDIPYLTARFVRECADRLGRPITGVAPSAERLLQQSQWPGNVRELRNVVERACMVSDSRILSERDLLTALAPQHAALESAVATPLASVSTQHGDAAPANSQQARIERALRQTRGNKAAAAKVLGMSRRSLYRWIHRLHMSR
ncbi:MAG: sigma-54-dependent transcriptional regulator [Vicinamibacterales bacterium]